MSTTALIIKTIALNFLVLGTNIGVLYWLVNKQRKNINKIKENLQIIYVYIDGIKGFIKVPD